MSARYDRAVTVFSPDGHLLQVEYAAEAVRRGFTAVGVRGKTVIVIGAEKKPIAKLQDERTVRKIFVLDEHILIAFAGVAADARVLISRAQVECQSHRLTVEEPVTLEYITRFIAGLKQKYTQSNGRRPFGISCIIGGFNLDGKPHLYQTDPCGLYYEWKASATGRAAMAVREFLEKNYSENEMSTENGAVKLAIKSLLEVVQSGQNNIEIAVMKEGGPMKMLNNETINSYVKVIENEKKDAMAKETIFMRH